MSFVKIRLGQRQLVDQMIDALELDQTQQAERRSGTRYSLGFMANIIIYRDDTIDRAPAYALNISRTGFCVLSDERFDMGNPLQVDMYKLFKRTIILNGNVRNQSPAMNGWYRTGLELTFVD